MKLKGDEEFVLIVLTPKPLELISSGSDESVNVFNNE